MEKEVICVVCPSSCRITVRGNSEGVSEIQGFGCKRGEEYAKHEFLAPVRMLTTTAKAEGYVSPVISVRTDKGIPKELQFECMKEIRKIKVNPPFFVGRVVIENVLGTGANVILSNC